MPFIYAHCSGWQPIATLGMSLGAYHAANSLFKHPDIFKRCFAMSGVYDMKRFMDGMYDDNVLLQQPGRLPVERLATAGSTTSTGPATSTSSPARVRGSIRAPSYHFSSILTAKGIPHSLDDWGPLGGHDWPYWRHMMWEYVSKLY